MSASVQPAADVQSPSSPSRVDSKWDALRTSEHEAAVPAILFVLCKTVIDNDQGGLSLNATVVQRVLLEAPLATPPPLRPLEDTLLFEIKVKGPRAGGEIASRRKGLESMHGGNSYMAYETLDLKAVPLDVRQQWRWFPFRIIRATIDLELQAKNINFGQREVQFCPDLCVSNIKDNVARVQVRGSVNRSSRLELLEEQPVVHMVQDKRFKKGLLLSTMEGHNQQVEEYAAYQANLRAGVPVPRVVPDPDENLFITYPSMRLTFYLHELPTNAMTKIVGPLLLVISLMLVNYHVFYGFDVRDGCPGEERDPGYLTNTILIAVAAATRVPEIRADRKKSPYISYFWDSLMAVVFLVGFALSTWPHCHVAMAGCLLSSLVVVSMVVSGGRHYFVRRTLRKSLTSLPQLIETDNTETNVTFGLQHQ
ncbi:unnamed protein product [Ectocarpus sp. 12 AP-2014]